MIKQCIKSVAARFGLDVRRVGAARAEPEFPLGGYDLEEDARTAIRRVRTHTMVPYRRLVVLYQQVVHCERHGLPGCYVECGTWKGGASGLMALANMAHARARRHMHLFDSFQGIPEPVAEKDGSAAVAWAIEHGAGAAGKLQAIQGAYESVGTLEVNRELIENRLGYAPQFLHYHVGWFQDTVPRDASGLGPIAILRLDGDWYESTRVCLEHLYEHVVPGGFVIMDDYNAVEGCKRATDEFIASRGLRVFLNHLDGHGRYWIKP